jgi:hypothetical protein
VFKHSIVFQQTSPQTLFQAVLPTLIAIILVGCGGGGGGGAGSRGAAIDASFEGFGAVTRGGAGSTEVRVTNLDDGGPGSLREALSGGDRTIVFDVGGTIELSDELSLAGGNVTIDGNSAPSPGITLRGAGIDIDGVEDVIVRNIRIRDSGREGDDGIAIENGARRVLLHAVSIDDSGDGNLDITGDASDVTVQYSILSNTKKNSLNTDSERITFHHNVFFAGQSRNAQFRFSNRGSRVSEDTMGDFRNNVIWNWEDGGGTLVECGAKVNVIANFYECGDCSAEREESALILKHGCSGNSNGELAFTAGNFSNDGARLDSGSAEAEWPAPAIQTDDACTGAREAQASAGARPLDEIDEAVLDALRIPEGSC